MTRAEWIAVCKSAQKDAKDGMVVSTTITLYRASGGSLAACRAAADRLRDAPEITSC